MNNIVLKNFGFSQWRHQLYSRDSGPSSSPSTSSRFDGFYYKTYNHTSRLNNKPKRRLVERRAHSTVNLDTEALESARNHFRKGRCVNATNDDNKEEKIFLSSKIDNLAKKLFHHVTIAKSTKPQHDNYRNEKHSYKTSGAAECLELEKKSKERALAICRAFIQKSTRYNLVQQLNSIGSRADKHWFLVRDVSLKTDRLLTLTPMNDNCPLNISQKTQSILNELFLSLQHPYICPLLHLELIEFEDQFFVIVIHPINQGSLKDLIYGVHRYEWNENWEDKYSTKGKGLPISRVQQMGRQILEALVFLKERGFPTLTHLHSGNVIVQNGVARLAGLENTLLGLSSRINHLFSHAPRTDSTDIILFGHLMFEMCTGYELVTLEPSFENFIDLEQYPQIVGLMKMIFDRTKTHLPTVQELRMHEFFRHIELREMRSAQVTIFRPISKRSVRNLLEKIKRQNFNKSTIPPQGSNFDYSMGDRSCSTCTCQLYNGLIHVPP